MWFRSKDHAQHSETGQLDQPMIASQNNASLTDDQPYFGINAAQSLFDLNYSLYVTENHADSYAYPLITYLHEGYRSEQDLWNWFPAISDQNYLGLGVRAPFPHPQGLPGQFEWKLRRPDASMAAIRETVQSVQFDWTIHPKRTYLFGEGDGAIVALQNLILQQSLEYDAVFANGVICRTLPKHWTDWIPHIENQLHGRVLLLDPLLDADEYAAVVALSEAGLEVTMAPTTDQTLPAAIINHWIMAGINSAVY